MQIKIRRRAFLTASGAAAAVPLLGLGAPGVAARSSAHVSIENVEGMSAYQLGPQIWLRWNNRPLTCYRAHRSQKYPYFFPVQGPVSGLSLTDETTLPYPHHRSLFFGCDKVNGGNYWQEELEKGQILSTGPKLGQVTKEAAEIQDSCEWKKPDGPVIMTDQRRISVTVPNPDARMISCEIVMTAVEDITVLKTNHSLFSMRAAIDITPKGGGVLVNAEGDTGEKGTFGKKSGWCSFYGKRAGMPDVTEGITMFDDPKNPWAPTQWFTRDYGFASPTPFNFLEKWQLPAGKSATLRYAVVLHKGDPVGAGIGALFQTWARKA